jgi:hypothetical protein
MLAIAWFAFAAHMAGHMGAASAPELRVELLLRQDDIKAVRTQGAWERHSLADCSHARTPEATKQCRKLALPSLSYRTARTPDGLIVERGITYSAAARPVPRSGRAVLQGQQILLSYRTCATARPGGPMPMYIGRMQVAWLIHDLPPGTYTFAFRTPRNEGSCGTSPNVPAEPGMVR